mmetsp:Transcript_3586/g.6301  ORF Transcript_3586/g.6301 Transcript_3586/m.6301 type:complete len:87 (+) Transcript_3586:568-828(+)
MTSFEISSESEKWCRTQDKLIAWFANQDRNSKIDLKGVEKMQKFQFPQSLFLLDAVVDAVVKPLCMPFGDSLSLRVHWRHQYPVEI